MKNSVLLIFSLSLILFSCKTTQIMTSNDDVYSDPIEERKVAIAKAEALRKKQAEEEKAQKDADEAARLAQLEKDAKNPYYKDPQYSSDDYYDYAYASRMRRFQNPMNGTGYYDNYYTNAYSYNQNPSCYGTSIYSSYNWWNSNGSPGGYMGNSYGNNGYNGLSYGMGYGYGSGYGNGYGSYGYSPYNSCYGSNSYYGYNQPNNMYGYNPWNNYYGNGYNSNSNWGYYNSYDVNSNYTYAPRQGSIGGNSVRGSYAGMAMPKDLDGERVQFVNAIAEKQESTPRFTNIERKATGTNINTAYPDNGSNSNNSGRVYNGSSQNGNVNTGSDQNTGTTSRHSNNWLNTPVETTSGSGTTTSPHRNSSGTKLTETNNTKATENTNTFFNRSSGSENSGGSISAPRGGGGGGSTTRPR